MAYKILIKPLVFSDVENAFKWYYKQVSRLGVHPFVFSYLKAPIRRCRMKNFPYNVYYTVENDTITILGLAHFERSNVYIKRRLG